MYNVLMALALILFSHAALAWEYIPYADPFTDEDRSIVVSKTVIGDGMVAARCDEDGLNIMIMDERLHLKANEGVPVMWRFDDRMPNGSLDWIPSTKQTGAYVPSEDVSKILQRMKAGKKMALRLPGPDGHPSTYVLSLMGFTQQVNKLTCKPATGA